MQIILIFIITILTTFSPNTEKIDNCYDTYNNEGLHLFINDNGTPNNYEDDWVYDWEDNRKSIILTFN